MLIRNISSKELNIFLIICFLFCIEKYLSFCFIHRKNKIFIISLMIYNENLKFYTFTDKYYNRFLHK